CREDLSPSRESFEAQEARRKTTQEDDSEKLLKCLNLGGLVVNGLSRLPSNSTLNTAARAHKR
ncbi:hypothetical protein, partial [Massilia sp. TWP1-3-3]|uniref:hypothetical protein n=1 Tax=Massilia sp. TWP1-3-3 TaxID=2804573 RepID=UPI003CF785C6